MFVLYFYYYFIIIHLLNKLDFMAHQAVFFNQKEDLFSRIDLALWKLRWSAARCRPALTARALMKSVIVNLVAYKVPITPACTQGNNVQLNTKSTSPLIYQSITHSFLLSDRNVTCYWSLRQKDIPTCKHAMISVRQEYSHKMQIKRSISMARSVNYLLLILI